MEGKIDPGTANRIVDSWSALEAVEHGNEIESLYEHPGWRLVQHFVARARSDGMERLISSKGVLSKAEYAQRLALLDGMAFADDVAATVLDAAARAKESIRVHQMVSEAEGE